MLPQAKRPLRKVAAVYYDSLESSAAELSRLLLGEGAAAYAQFSERMAHVESLAGNMGWGYGDYIRDWAATLENELGSK